MAGAIEGQAAFVKWLKTFLKDRGWQPAGSGFRFGDDMKGHTVSLETGNWSDVSYSSNKPVRWLFNVDITQHPPTAFLPGELEESGIGFPNDSKGRSASLRVRIMPLLKTGDSSFEQPPFEAQALFVFHGGLSPVSSASAVFFNPNTGTLRRPARKDADHEDYIFAALLGLQPRDVSFTVNINGQDSAITYGEVLDALQSGITVHPKGSAAQLIAAYDLTESADLDRLKTDLSQAWDDAGPPPDPAVVSTEEGEADDDSEPLDFSHLEVPENPDLLGIDPAVYRQINAMLQSGKQHLMLYGPPGTGKTSLARWIASSLPGGKWTLITGSSDWSSQDIIGGYQPIGGGDVDFVPGILLRAFDQPLIIDELNRCDIDKVIGPLFTVLSGQQTTLPYRTELSDKDSQPYVILPQPKVGAADHEFAPGPAWRLLATINSIDKASLYQMSYALSRRFGWVYVDAPTDLREFVRSFLAHLDPVAPEPAGDAACPLADLWRAINAVRVIGPAPIIDAIKAIRVLDPAAAFFGPANDAMRSAALDALDMVLLPMLDGIVHQDAMAIADAAVAAFGLPEGQARRVRARLESVAI